MRFPWQSSEGDLERRLRANRPEAPDDLIHTLSARAGRRPARRPALAFAAVITTVFFVALAGFGGVSYAAKAVQSAASTVSSTLTASSTNTTQGGTPSDHQYTGFHGCTPGYWKQTQHFFAWGSIPRTQSYNQTFGVLPSKSGVANSFSLLDALSTGGGGLAALGRHAAAAYLNSQRPGMNFPYSTAQVIAMVQSAINSGNATTIENTKNTLEAANSLEGPLC